MQYLDALEGLRSQGFPEDPVTTRRHEILQRFIEGVRDEGNSLNTGVNYVSETTVTDPPTVDFLQFTTRQFTTRSVPGPNLHNYMTPGIP